MPEFSRRWLGVPALLAVLAAPLLGAVAPLGVLAGAVLAGLAVSRTPMRDALVALLGAWLAGLLLAGILMAWPLSSFARSGSLWSALAMSMAAGMVLLAAWRSWPLWSKVRAGSLDALRDWRRVIELQPAAWPGLSVALPVAVVLVGGIALGGPAMSWMPLRLGIAILLAGLLLWPLLRQRPLSARERIEKAEAHAAARPLRNAERIDIDSLFDTPRAAEAATGATMLDAADVPAETASTTEALNEAVTPSIGEAAFESDTGNDIATDVVPGDEAPSTGPAATTTELSGEEIAARNADLYLAARSGRVDQALALLEAGADPLAAPAADARDRRGLAQLAAVLPDLRLLRALIQRGVPLTAEPGTLTPLLAATRDSWHGRPEAVMTLLANGSDPRERDGEGNTPLHHAARSTDPGVAALLLDAAAELDALNDARQSPLAMACLAGNWRVAKFLVERGARTHPAGGDPVLLAASASEEDDPVGVQYLLRQKAAVDASGEGGRTALHQAAAAGHVAIVQTLLDAGADVRRSDESGLDAWLLAAPTGQLPVMEALLESGADLQAIDVEGRDALMRLAAEDGQGGVALARWLRERGIDTERMDASGRSALDNAVAAGRWSLVAAIDPNYPLPTANAAGDDDADIARPPMQLLSEALAADDRAGIAHLAGLLDSAELGRALVQAASIAPKRVHHLLAQRPSFEARGPQGESAMSLLLGKAGHADARDALEAMLDAGASPAGGGTLARFLAACLSTRVSETEGAPLADALLDRGADAFGLTAEGETSLLLALRLGWPRLALRLLALGADPNQADARGLTPLHVATALGLEAVVPKLLLHGAQPALRAGDGQTALGVALASGRRALADWLDWRGWPHPGRPLRAGDLASAAILGDADAVQRLIAFGFDVDTRDAQGCTALLRAAGGGHEAVVAHLLTAGADTSLASDSGATPLSAAVSMRHLAVIDRLLAAGVDLDRRLPGGVTVLMLAAALGLPDVASRLLAAGADLDAGDAEGLKPMHCAALFGFSTRDRSRLLALFDALHLAGAEPDDATETGLTPLLLLLGARAEPGAACDETVLVAGMERLLDEGATLAVQDQRGFGPLHLAALHGLRQVVRELLRAGADPDLRDRLNRSPREIATMRGFMDVAAEFLPADSVPSMARYLREPRA